MDAFQRWQQEQGGPVTFRNEHGDEELVTPNLKAANGLDVTDSEGRREPLWCRHCSSTDVVGPYTDYRWLTCRNCGRSTHVVDS